MPVAKSKKKSTRKKVSGNGKFDISQLPYQFQMIDLGTLKPHPEQADTREITTEALSGLAGSLAEGVVEEISINKRTGHIISGHQRCTDPDEVPATPKEAKTKTGDLYQLGSHRLLCGDATKKEDVERLMGGEKAEMVFTDPPYGVGYDGGVQTPRDKLCGDQNTDLYAPCCSMAMTFSVVDAPLYLWHAGVKGIAAAAAAAAAGWEIRSEIIWNKNQAQYGALSAQYKQKHEPAYYCFKCGHSARWVGSTKEVTVWDIDRASKNEFHPTQKAVELATRAIGNHDAKSVLDLFLGSGTTMIACEQLDRKCFGIEIDPLYVDVCVKRWEDFTGRVAVLQEGA